MDKPQDQSAAAQPISSKDDLAPFVHTAPTEIAYQLKQLAQKQVFVSVYFNNGQQMTLTRILDVDLKARRFVFDLGGSDAANQALLASMRSIFVAAPDGVKIQFVLDRIERGSFEGKPAFAAAFPADLIKLQRREYFRILTPIARPFVCRVQLGGQAQELALHDISLGGAGLWVPDALAAKLELGQRLEGAALELGAAGGLRIDMLVRSLRPVQQGNLQRHLAGCQFMALPQAAEAILQRLMAQLERDRKALLG